MREETAPGARAHKHWEKNCCWITVAMLFLLGKRKRVSRTVQSFCLRSHLRSFLYPKQLSTYTVFSFPIPVPRNQSVSFPSQLLPPLLALRLAGEWAEIPEVSTFFTVPKEKHRPFCLQLMVNHHVGRKQLKLQELPILCPDQCGSVGWASFCKVRGHWFLVRAHARVSSLDGAHMRGNRWMLFLSLSSSFPLSLKINKILKKKT